MTWWEDAVGRSAELTRTFSGDDLTAYCQLAGDSVESEQVPEPLVAGLFSTLLGVHLPGPGTNYLKQWMSFSSPAVVGQPLRAAVEVTSVHPEKRLVRLSTSCATADGTVICRGEALVLAGGVPMAPPTGTD